MKYDIIVIGAGSGGLNIASFMNKAGFNVLLVDKSDRDIGGDCLNYGCVPSKALIHISRLIYNAKESTKFGFKISGEIDIKRVVEYITSKKEFIRTHENADYFRKQGMDVVLGFAKFISKDSIEVEGKKFSAKKIVIATGSMARKLDIPGVEKLELYNNESIFNLNHLPKKFLFIGGGPIGIELGQALNRLGSEVTIVQNINQFLQKEDKEIADVLLQQLKKEGIKFKFNSVPIKAISKNEVLIRNKDGKEEIVKCDSVFVGIGRQLNLEGLDLNKAGIKHSERKIEVNEYLQTTNSNIYLCGDIVGSYQFTHAAEMHAGVLINNFFSPLKKKINYDNIAWVTYTYPEIATFGLKTDELKKRNIEFEVINTNFEHDDRAIVDNFTNGKVKLYISNNKILGGTMVAPNAGELIQELILANSAKLSITELFKKVYPYPTASRINKKAISSIFSRKLNPFSKKLMRWLY